MRGTGAALCSHLSQNPRQCSTLPRLQIGESGREARNHVRSRLRRSLGRYLLRAGAKLAKPQDPQNARCWPSAPLSLPSRAYLPPEILAFPQDRRCPGSPGIWNLESGTWNLEPVATRRGAGRRRTGSAAARCADPRWRRHPRGPTATRAGSVPPRRLPRGDG